MSVFMYMLTTSFVALHFQTFMTFHSHRLAMVVNNGITQTSA